AGDDDRAHLRMLEADAIERVVQLDVDAEVVAVELQLVSGLDAAVLGHVQMQPRDLSLDLQAPVTVLAGLRAIVDSRQGVVTHGVSPGSSVARRWVENGWEGADGRAQVAGMTRWRSQASYCIPKRLVKQPVMQQ